MICAKCRQSFNGEPPKFLLDINGKKVTIVFCSEECKDDYEKEEK